MMSSGRPRMSGTSVACLTCVAWQRGTPALLRLVSSYSVSMPNQHMPRWHACVYLLHWTTARQVLPTRMFTNAPQSRQLVSCKAWGSTSQGPPRHTIYTLLPPAAAASNPQPPPPWITAAPLPRTAPPVPQFRSRGLQLLQSPRPRPAHPAQPVSPEVTCHPCASPATAQA